ncbi:NAD(P)-binding protein [Exidia glandulosa HHB12029]|uniref:NAD(P)-binding protein n=1 Tax=Exidia glandulosa HHB12029 TaxID=1314781 RepID=A0A165HY16_EXIGL|nr:NAD(P)-binding protein [Exidia glandulosa HHB12029]
MPTWLITGTSRGIGLELTRQLAARAGNTIFATCRSPSSATALNKIASEHPDSVHVLDLDVTKAESANDAANKVKALLGASKGIDYLVNNAGLAVSDTVDVVKAEDLEAQFSLHVVGSLNVFRAFRPLVEASERKVVVQVSTTLGSFAHRDYFKGAAPAYSIAKAAMNMLTYKLHIQYPDLVIFAFTPGWIKTDLGGEAAPLEVGAAVTDHIKVYEAAKLETHAGKFLNYDGTETPW